MMTRSGNDHRRILHVRLENCHHRSTPAGYRPVHRGLDLVHLVGVGAGEGGGLEDAYSRKIKLETDPRSVLSDEGGPGDFIGAGKVRMFKDRFQRGVWGC